MRGVSGEKNKVEERIAVAFEKKERGDELTEEDWVLIQYTLGAGTCHSCGNSGVVVATRGVSGGTVNGAAR